MYVTEQSSHPLREWAREVIEKNRKKREMANRKRLEQSDIDAREKNWAETSDSVNARFARVLGSREGQQ